MGSVLSFRVACRSAIGTCKNRNYAKLQVATLGDLRVLDEVGLTSGRPF
jgi:hypothetical protein